MTAIFWQTTIAVTILGAFLLGYLLFSLKRSIQLGSGVTFFWLVWTMGLSNLFVGYSIKGQLANFQFSLIIITAMAGTALVIFFYWSQHRYDRILSENENLRKELEELLSEFNVSKLNKNLKPSRIVRGTQRHRNELIHQLRNASNRVLILSGWVTQYGFDRDVRQLLEQAINRDVQIHIGWGYKSKSEAQQRRKMTDSERELIKFALKHKNNVVLAYFQNHSKLLIVDSKCIIGSFSWLSNAFSRNDELSAIIEHPDFIEDLWNSVVQDIHRYSIRKSLDKTKIIV